MCFSTSIGLKLPLFRRTGTKRQQTASIAQPTALNDARSLSVTLRCRLLKGVPNFSKTHVDLGMKIRIPLLLLLLLPAFVAVPVCVDGQLFTKIMQWPITTTASGSRSCNFLDFNNDDFQDILITNGKQGGEDNMLYRNERDGTFTLMNDTVCHDGTPSDGATCADFDNDGFIDMYVANWYGVNNLLYQNDSGSGFARIGTGIVPNDHGYSETAAWGDMDNDGLVDLYVANSDGNFRNYLYHNLGRGDFEKITTGLPATEQYASRCVNWIDYDRDGDQDLFVANESSQRNNLYRNDGYPNFTKITTGALVTSQFSSHSSSWADYDNDGDFDVLIANYNQVNQLFQNDGAGNFTQVPSPWNGDVGCAFSSSFADYDNDADLDLFITNGYCTSYTHNFLYENNGNGTFTRNLSEPMAIDSGSSYGCAWGDYDNDGFMDLVVANWRNEIQPNALYHNNGNGNHWLRLKLQGMFSNRSAIGAIVRCNTIVNGNPVWQMREVSAQTGYCSQNSLVVHFGLGDGAFIDSLQVIWPSGMVQLFQNLNADTYYDLEEGGLLGIVGNTQPRSDEMQLDIVPNPNNGTFSMQIETPRSLSLDVEILDLQGRAVYAKELNVDAGNSQVPIALLVPSGIYYVRLLEENGTHYVRKMVIGN
jgi:enediyne biosynthesis protein E4